MAADPQPPVFIISCARSGSTLLRLICDTHPQIWSPPELHLLTLCQKLLWVHGVLADTGERDDAFWDQAAERTRADVLRLLEPPLSASGKSIWCEKSVTSVNHLDILEGVFPDARCVFLYRAMPDMVASGLRATADRADGFDFEPWFLAWPHSRIEALAHYWLEKTRAMLEAEKKPGPALRMNFDALVTQPQAQAGRLADFLQLEAPADWIDAVYRQPHQSGPGDDSAYRRDRIDPGTLGAGRELDLSGLPRRLVRQINRCSSELDLPTIAP